MNSGIIFSKITAKVANTQQTVATAIANPPKIGVMSIPATNANTQTANS